MSRDALSPHEESLPTAGVRPAQTGITDPHSVLHLPPPHQGKWSILDLVPVVVFASCILLEVVVEIIEEAHFLRLIVTQSISLVLFLGIGISAALVVVRTYFAKRVVFPLIIGVLLLIVYQTVDVFREIPPVREALHLGGGTLEEVIARRVTLTGGLGLLLGSFYLALLELRRLHLRSLWERDALVQEIAERKNAQDELTRYKADLEVLVNKRTIELQKEVAERKEIEQALHRAHDELEQHVQERTAQLFRTNEELLEEVEDRKRAEEALRNSEILYHSLVENLPQCIFRKDLEGRFTFCNQRFSEELGIPIEKILGRTDADFFPAEQAGKYRSDDLQVMENGSVFEDVEEHRSPTRETIFVQVIKTPLCDAEGKIMGVQGIFWDITERKRAEEERLRLERQVQHAQKLESLGVLAGGIAHDFNNLLMGVLGNADLALDDLSPVSPVRGCIEDIQKAAKRAAELTRQMLAYSGRGSFLITGMNLNELIQEMMHLLKSSISKKVEIETRFAPDLPTIVGDSTQICQVVMNLITNASDAIGDRNGIIVISTGVMECDRPYLRQIQLGQDLPEGPYAYFEISDNGCGMDKETLDRIFDPFFTTKFIGRGLGLAAVLGIIRGHRGAIRVVSSPGRGTTFTVLLPKEGQSGPMAPTAATEPERWHGTGTVLVVDDEEFVRSIARSMLERMGFTVLTAGDGKEGVEVFRDNAEDISAVLLDLTMPQMSGEEALGEIMAIRPDAKVLLSSGYTEEETYERLSGRGFAGFVRKPYTLDDLRQKIRSVL